MQLPGKPCIKNITLRPRNRDRAHRVLTDHRAPFSPLEAMTAPGTWAHSRAFEYFNSKNDRNYLNKYYPSKKDLKQMKKDHLFLLIPLAFLAFLAWPSGAMPASDGTSDTRPAGGEISDNDADDWEAGEAPEEDGDGMLVDGGTGGEQAGDDGAGDGGGEEEGWGEEEEGWGQG